MAVSDWLWDGGCGAAANTCKRTVLHPGTRGLKHVEVWKSDSLMHPKLRESFQLYRKECNLLLLQNLSNADDTEIPYPTTATELLHLSPSITHANPSAPGTWKRVSNTYANFGAPYAQGPAYYRLVSPPFLLVSILRSAPQSHYRRCDIARNCEVTMLMFHSLHHLRTQSPCWTLRRCAAARPPGC